MMFYYYFTRLFNWLLAFSGFDFPTRLPLLFFFTLCLALKAKGLLFFFIGIFFRLILGYKITLFSPPNNS